MFRKLYKVFVLLLFPAFGLFLRVKAKPTIESSQSHSTESASDFAEFQLQNDLLNLEKANKNGKLSDRNLEILEHKYPEIEANLELHNHKKLFQNHGHWLPPFLNTLQSSSNTDQGEEEWENTIPKGSVPKTWTMTMTPGSSPPGDETSNFSNKRIKTKDPSQPHYYLPLEQDHDFPIGISGLISNGSSPHVSSLSSSSSQIQCLCDTYECLSNGQEKCWTSGKCYTQFLQLSDGSPPLTKGCILGETPLLCENRRPKRPGPYPRLVCCSTNLCNSNYTLTSFPFEESSTIFTGFSSSVPISTTSSRSEEPYSKEVLGLERDYYYSEEDNEEDSSGSTGTIFEDSEPAGGLHDLSNFDLNDNVTEKSDGVYGHKIHMDSHSHGVNNQRNQAIISTITPKHPNASKSSMSLNGYTQAENLTSNNNSLNVDNNHYAYYNGIKISPLATGFLISGAIFVILISIIGYLVLRREQTRHEETIEKSHGSDSEEVEIGRKVIKATGFISIDSELESESPHSKSSSISIEPLSASPRTPLRRKNLELDYPDVEFEIGRCIAHFDEETVESAC